MLMMFVTNLGLNHACPNEAPRTSLLSRSLIHRYVGIVPSQYSRCFGPCLDSKNGWSGL